MTSERAELLICIPVFDDWVALGETLAALDRVARGLEGPVSVLVIDDGSREPPPETLSFVPSALRRVEVLPLRTNLGHQRAIAIGLTFIHAQRPCRAVVVMDADGQDSPDDVPVLLRALAAHQARAAVFAARTRRSDGPAFWLGYRLYKALHLALTGKRVEVGNFSALPPAVLARLVGVSEIWNHYAAAVFKARLPVVQVPVERAARRTGDSKMSFVGLVTHGLSAISVHGEIVGARLVCWTAAWIALTILGLVAAIGLELGRSGSLTGEALTWVGLLMVWMVGLLSLLTVAVLFLLQSRERMSFIPLRDYAYYTLPERVLFG